MEDLKISAVDKLKQYGAQREVLGGSHILANIVGRALSALYGCQ